MIEFRLPSLGAEMDEGTLLEWKVKPGDRVRKGDVVAVVDTSKSAIDVEIWEKAPIWELVLERAGDRAGRHRHGAAARARARRRSTRRRRSAGAPRRCRARAVAGGAGARRVAARPVASPAAGDRGAGSASRRRPASARPSSGLRPRAGRRHRPATARSRARTSSGRRRPAAPPEGPVAEMRRAIAAAMARSKREIPHYYLATDIPLARRDPAGSPRATSSGRSPSACCWRCRCSRPSPARSSRYPEFNGLLPRRRVRAGRRHSPRRRDLAAPGRTHRARDPRRRRDGHRRADARGSPTSSRAPARSRCAARR